jgi:membrane protease YdiL (CAAX protease family)
MKKTVFFLLLAFGLSWLIALIFHLAGGDLSSPFSIAVLILYMFMPMVAALIVQKYVTREPIAGPLGIRFTLNWWWLVALLMPLALAFLSIWTGNWMPGVEYSPGMEGMFDRYQDLMTAEELEQMQKSLDSIPIHPLLLGALQGLLAAVTINGLAAFGEELGWRGFLLRQFGKMNFWPASVLIGLIWGLWHAPIILMGHNYPEHPVIGVGMMVVFCVLYSPLFTYVRIQSRSVIAVSVMHGAINGTAGIGIMMLAGGSDLSIGLTGLAGFIVLLLANILLVGYDIFHTRIPVMTHRIEAILDIEKEDW